VSLPPERLDQLTPEQKRVLLAQLLRKKSAQGQGGHELSHGQLALWFLHRLAPDNPSYNVPLAWWIRSEVDPDALRQAFQGLAERHALLRTAFVEEEGLPRRRVQREHAVDFDVLDASRWSRAELEERVHELAHRPFRLESGHPMRAHLLLRSAGEHVLVMVFHHIVYDLWSGMRVLGDLRELYRAALAGAPAGLPPLAHDYGDFARWQSTMLASPEGEAHWEYWSARLKRGAVPVLELPTDRPRPPVQTHEGATHKRQLPRELLERLRAFARAEGVTLFTVLLSAYQILLHRYSGQAQVIVGSPMTGRGRAEFDDVVGYFLNTLPLLADFSGDPPYRGFLEQIKDTVQGGLRHQEFPSDLIAERLHLLRDPSQTPLFQTMFVHNRAHGLAGRSVSVGVIEGTADLRVEMPPLVLETFPLVQRTAIVDLALTVHEADAALITAWQYNTDLFEDETIRRMATHLEVLLDDIVTHPDREIGALELLPASERRRILVEWNSEELREKSEEIAPVLFEGRVDRAPDALAAVGPGGRLTYRELERRANQLARHLRRKGAGPNTLVGIQLDRSLDMVVAVMGVWKSGAAYVPLDPTYPESRLEAIRSDAGLRLIVSRSDLLARAPGSELVLLDAQAAAIAAESDARPEPSATPDDLAYVIYTSGSTGKPKGVVVTHANLRGAYRAWEQAYDFAEGPGGHLQAARFSFDVSVGDFVRALCSGGHLVLPTEEELFTPELLYELLRSEGVRYFDIVPAIFRPLLAHLEATRQRLDFMRVVIVGADSWYVSEFERAARWCGPGTRLMNSYGVTEATIDSAFFEDSTEGMAKEGMIPIGRPLANTRMYVLDEKLRPVPVGVVGELCIGGPAVARGYLNRPELTAERFVPDPFGPPGGRLYRTGDIARFRPDGNVQLAGRADHQVKLRGFRIELQEIEATMSRWPHLAQVAVVLREDVPGDKRLVAYWVGNPDAPDLSSSDLRAWLREQLPEYMVPSICLRLEALPLMPNGKIDRRALPAPESSRPELAEEYAEPATELERRIAAAWGEVLKVDRVGKHDNFFDLGGNSLLILQVHSRLKPLFEAELPVIKMFEHPTVSSLAQFMSGPSAQSATVQRAQERAAARKKGQGTRPTRRPADS
jgi:amino acid adenylation domain-containing protein